MTPSKVAVILLNWNGKEDTLECLHSISEMTYPHYEVFVCDNGSTDGSIEAIKREFPHVILIDNGENLGFAEGNNRGIRAALDRGADYIFLLNNDTVVDKEVLSAFVSSKEAKSAIQGAKLYIHKDPLRFDHLGGKWNQKTAHFDLIGNNCIDDHKSFEEPMDLDYVCGAALFAPREIFQKIGALDSRFFLFWEENDFCMRAKRKGFTIRLCPQAKVWHKVSSSFVGGRPHINYFWWRSRLLWIKRNLKQTDKKRVYQKVIIPDFLHNLKLYLLKRGQLAVRKRIRPKEDQTHRLQKLLGYRAAVCGVKDYFLGKYGEGPAWLFANRTSKTPKS